MRIKLTKEAANKDFKDILVDHCSEDVQFQPRDSRQTRYYKEKDMLSKQLGSDAIVNIHELAYTLPGFVWSVRTFPDLVVCFGMTSLLDVLKSPSLLSYDTTFNLGDFYLSVLVVKLSTLLESPCIPVAFVVHERKFQAAHDEFCEQLSQRLKCRQDHILVIDGEINIVKAFSQRFPTWTVVSCWNHILTDVEIWLKKHHGIGQDIVVYKSHVRELLQCTSDDQLSRKEATLKDTWSEAFHQYYNDHIRERLCAGYTGRLQQVGLSVESVTTNMSGVSKCCDKRFQGWRENTADLCLLSLYRLHAYYNTQLMRSSSGYGPYSTNYLCNDNGDFTNGNIASLAHAFGAIRFSVLKLICAHFL